jgi:hypothetical protein
MNSITTVKLTPELRALIVRQLGAALAEAYRRRERDRGLRNVGEDEETREGATDGASTSSAAV